MIRLLRICISIVINWYFNRKRRLKLFILFIFIFVLITTLHNRFEIKFFSNNKPSLSSRNYFPSNLTIFCIILTQPANFLTKTLAVNKTWAPECDNYRFISTIPDIYLKSSSPSILVSNSSSDTNHPFPILQPHGYTKELAYKNLTAKVYASFIAVYERFPNYDWYLKADDDTFVIVDNLRLFLARLDSNDNESITCGLNAKDGVFHTGEFRSGGAGYVLSKRAFQQLGSRLVQEQPCPRCGVEDLDVALCLREIDNVRVENTVDEMGRQRFHSDSIDKVVLMLIIIGHLIFLFIRRVCYRYRKREKRKI